MAHEPTEFAVLRADAAGLSAASARLLAGGCVAFPTETVYGLGADAPAAAAAAAAAARARNEDEEGRAEEGRAEEGRAEEGRAEEGRAEEGCAIGELPRVLSQPEVSEFVRFQNSIVCVSQSGCSSRL